MMPLLTLYADFVGILGGLVIGIGMLDLGLIQYIEETRNAVDLPNVAIGLVKALIFAIMVAPAACPAGMRCGRSASAAGDATTTAHGTPLPTVTLEHTRLPAPPHPT